MIGTASVKGYDLINENDVPAPHARPIRANHR